MVVFIVLFNGNFAPPNDLVFELPPAAAPPDGTFIHSCRTLAVVIAMFPAINIHISCTRSPRWLVLANVLTRVLFPGFQGAL